MTENAAQWLAIGILACGLAWLAYCIFEDWKR
jgi:hypothetical protein